MFKSFTRDKLKTNNKRTVHLYHEILHINMKLKNHTFIARCVKYLKTEQT